MRYLILVGTNVRVCDERFWRLAVVLWNTWSGLGLYGYNGPRTESENIGSCPGHAWLSVWVPISFDFTFIVDVVVRCYSIDIVIVIINITIFVWSTAPEDDSSSTDENKTDPSCDDSQETAHGQRTNNPGADVAKSKPTPKPRFSANNGNDAALSSPEYSKKASKSGDTVSASAAAAAKPNSCTSSEKSSDSGVSTSSSVCFGNMTRGKRNGTTHQLNGKNSFGGHLVQQNVKDWVCFVGCFFSCSRFLYILYYNRLIEILGKRVVKGLAWDETWKKTTTYEHVKRAIITILYIHNLN